MSAWLDVQAEAIPPELRALPWVLWRAAPRGDGKPAKVPYRVADPLRPASTTDPATWGTFADAVDAYSALGELEDTMRGPVVGLGVVLTAATTVACIDLDAVLVGDTLDPRAALVVAGAHSWTERSPSGTGLHIFGWGTLPRAIKAPQIEVYADARYIAVTGHRWPDTPAELRDVQSYLDRLLALDTPTSTASAWTGPRTPPPDDLAGALLAKLTTWGVPVTRVKRWQDGYLVELPACPWTDEHTSGPGGAAVMIRASGAYDFTCLHAHCVGRTWRDFRAVMDSAR